MSIAVSALIILIVGASGANTLAQAGATQAATGSGTAEVSVGIPTDLPVIIANNANRVTEVGRIHLQSVSSADQKLYDARSNVLLFSPDRKTLVTATQYYTPGVTLWDVASLNQKQTFPIKISFPANFGNSLSPDGTLLTMNQDDTAGHVFDLTSGKDSFTIPNCAGRKCYPSTSGGKIADGNGFPPPL